jgi:hypothetical protein
VSERECVWVSARECERVRVSVWVSVWVCERVSVCVWECECERVSVSERERDEYVTYGRTREQR